MNRKESVLEEKKIILVENDPDHADLIAEILEEGGTGREVLRVRDGMEAIDCFQELGASCNGQIKDVLKLIIIDLDLPKIDGMDILKFLKKNPKYSRVPVIILSTSSEKKIINEAYKNGADDYVTKPLSFEEFIIKLKSIKEAY